MLTAGVDTEVQGESTTREEQQVDVRELEHVPDGPFRYLPKDSYSTKASFASTPNR